MASRLTSGFTAATPHPQRRSQKRNRVPLSCSSCRTRKLKCNREQPCQNCITRNESSSCSFAKSEASTSRGNGSSLQQRQKFISMQQQIDQLENVVANLMSGNKSDARLLGKNHNTMVEADYEKNIPETERQLGVMKIDENHSSYTGSTHWADVMQELSALKDTWSMFQEEVEEQSENESSAEVMKMIHPALCSIPKQPNKTELLACVPPRSTVENLVSRFFDWYDPAIPATVILHRATFTKQCLKHWINPSDSSVMWLGLLFSVLCLGVRSYLNDDEGEQPPHLGISQSLADIFHMRCGQCMALADITKSAPYTVETMVFHELVEVEGEKNKDVAFWMTIGVMVRVAMRMGYHRDGAQYSRIPPFQCEMRRRTWAFITQLDSLYSYQVGLPNMVRLVYSDTLTPHNLMDSDLSEDMVELPKPRPVSEPTAVSYLIAKNRLLRVLASIDEHISSLLPGDYDRVIQLDRELTEAHSMVPPHLQPRSLEESSEDPIYIIWQRAQIEFLYRKGLCILHRRYLSAARRNPCFSTSRQKCLDSARALLSYQIDLHQESKIGGRLRNKKWHKVPVTSSNFSLAAMILCLELHQETLLDAKDVGRYGNEDQLRDKILCVLSDSNKIWKEVQSTSVNVRRVSNVLEATLRKFGQAKSENHPIDPASTMNIDTNSINSLVYQAEPHGIATENSSSDPFQLSEIFDWHAWEADARDSSVLDLYPDPFDINLPDSL
ncbi:MAG: hypothetical protein M1834_006539 [Cirrosporium novae-zelandiae]|nr:MAG: hypothetical protein M1834_006539 [Cirrosporium novae-zelandiae]